MKSDKKWIPIVIACVAVVFLAVAIVIVTNDKSLPVDSDNGTVSEDPVGEVTTTVNSEQEQITTTTPDVSDEVTDTTTTATQESTTAVTTTTEATTTEATTTVTTTEETEATTEEPTTTVTTTEEEVEVEIEDEDDYEVDIEDEDVEVEIEPDDSDDEFPEWDPNTDVNWNPNPDQSGDVWVPDNSTTQLQSAKYSSNEYSEIDGDAVNVTESYEYSYVGNQVYSIERQITVETENELTLALYKSAFKGIIKDKSGIAGFSGEVIEGTNKYTIIMKFDNLNDPATAKVLLEAGLITGDKTNGIVYLSDSVGKLTEDGFVKER